MIKRELQPSSASPSWLSAAIVAGLFLCVFLAFFPALFADFVAWDDGDVLLSHTRYHGLTVENLRWMFTTTHNGHWMPLTWMSYAVDHAIWGMNPRGYHLTNILLHAINAGLVYVLSLRLICISKGIRTSVSMSVQGAAAFAALLFAVHPLRVESVAWVTERRDVLSAALLIGAAWAYLRAVEPDRPGVRSWGTYLLAIALLMLSVMSKAWGMSFFVVALIMDWFPLRRLPFNPLRWMSRGARSVLVEKIPFIVIGVFALTMAGRAAESASAAKSLTDWSLVSRVVQMLYGLFFYIRATLVPMGLSPLYELPIPLNPRESRFIAAYVFAVLAAIAMWMLRRRRPAIIAAMAVYCVILAPVLGVHQSGEQFVADRYSYLACIGLVIVAAAGVLRLFETAKERRLLSPRLIVVGCAAVVLVLAAMTFNQAAIWRNTESLWRHALAVTPSPNVRTNLAIELLRTSQTDDAMQLLEAVVSERPTDGRAWFMLGNELRRAGRFGQAERAYTSAIEHSPMRYTARVNLGAMYLKQMNRPADALEQFHAAVLDVEQKGAGNRPLSALPYLALGDALRRTGDPEGARAAFTKALAFDETKAQAAAELKSLGK